AVNDAEFSSVCRMNRKSSNASRWCRSGAFSGIPIAGLIWARHLRGRRIWILDYVYSCGVVKYFVLQSMTEVRERSRNWRLVETGHSKPPFSLRSRRARRRISPPPVVDIELETGIRREKLIQLAQTLAQRAWRQQRILALAQIVVIHVNKSRKHVDGDCVGKRRGQVFVPCALGIGPAAGCDLARLPGINAGFAAYTALHLFPRQVGKSLGNAGLIHERMRHVDVELKRDGELVVHQPGGDEHALRVAQVEIAVADRVIAQPHIVA